MPAPTPDPQETQGEFMDRCMLENDTEDEGERWAECRTSWDESQDEEDPPGPGDGSGESASARRYRSINYSSSYTRGGSMNIKEIRQERADLMGEEQELKQSARALLNKPMDDERRNELLSQKEGRLEALGTRLVLLAKHEAQWERFKEDEIRQPAAREGDDGTRGSNARSFSSFGDRLVAVAQAGLSGGRVDPRLQYVDLGGGTVRAVSGASEGVGADGGFLVGQDESNELLRNIHETGVLLSRVRKRPITSTSNRLRIRAVNETSRADGSRMGGIRVYREGEGATLTASKPGFNGIEFEAKKLTGLYFATDELLEDAPALQAEVGDWFNDEFGFKIDDEIVNGNGVAEMLGILNSPALVTVDKEGNQAANTILAENVFNMWSRMWGPSRANAVWIYNQDIEPQLFTMKVDVGTGGVPVYIPANGISGSPFAMLMGRPLVPVEQCPTLGTVGDLMLVNLDEYIVAEKGLMRSDVSIHVKFLEDETAFRFILRNDGKPRWKSALTPNSGSSNTLSPFVALATRP